MQQLELIGGKPKRFHLKKMHVSDAGEVHGRDSVRYQCPCCGLETGWIEEESITIAKRGIPCLSCNGDKLRVLHLNLKEKWWNDINEGKKDFEYREQNQYWKTRLVGKQFDYVFIKLGYPAKDELEKIIVFRWNGYLQMRINHGDLVKKLMFMRLI